MLDSGRSLSGPRFDRAAYHRADQRSEWSGVSTTRQPGRSPNARAAVSMARLSGETTSKSISERSGWSTREAACSRPCAVR